MAIYLGNTRLTNTGVQVDDSLSSSSTNPVENKAFAAPLIYTVKQVQKDVLKEMNEQEVVNAGELVSSTSMINPVALDLSSNTQLKKLTCSGTSTTPLTSLSSVTVSYAAPLDSTTSPQIDVSYSSLNRTSLLSMFNSMPYNIGYTVVGSPTIVDGVVSGFSSSDYLTLPSFGTSFKSYEVFAKFTTGNVNTQQAVLGTSIQWNRYGFFITSSAELYSGVYIGSSRYNVQSSLTLQANTTYYAQMKADLLSNTMTLKVSTDNATWTTDSRDLPEATSFSTFESYKIGYTQHGSFSGSIDLNNTYIKVNGIPWFRGTAAMTKTVSVVGCTGTVDLTAADKAIAEDKGWAITLS